MALAAGVRNAYSEIFDRNQFAHRLPKEKLASLVTTKNRGKEVASGVTLRSELMIDCSNFGELGEILKANWTIFGDTLRDISAVQKILGSLYGSGRLPETRR